MVRRMLAALFAFTLLAAACGDDDDADDGGDTTTTEAATDDTTADDATDGDATEPVTGPATISADDQTGDGTTVTVASVTLPTDGFVVIHADGGGVPGAILGWSDLLDAGESTDVVVTLNTPIDADATVYPMAHVDANGNGVYEFQPPDVTTDVPATTADGQVAVLPISYTIG